MLGIIIMKISKRNITDASTYYVYRLLVVNIILSG